MTNHHQHTNDKRTTAVVVPTTKSVVPGQTVTTSPRFNFELLLIAVLTTSLAFMCSFVWVEFVKTCASTIQAMPGYRVPVPLSSFLTAVSVTASVCGLMVGLFFWERKASLREHWHAPLDTDE